MFSNTKKDAQGQESNLKTVGFFKGIVHIESREEKSAYLEKK